MDYRRSDIWVCCVGLKKVRDYIYSYVSMSLSVNDSFIDDSEVHSAGEQSLESTVDQYIHFITNVTIANP